MILFESVQVSEEYGKNPSWYPKTRVQLECYCDEAGLEKLFDKLRDEPVAIDLSGDLVQPATSPARLSPPEKPAKYWVVRWKTDGQYLVERRDGSAKWTSLQSEATRFKTKREAARAKNNGFGYHARVCRVVGK